MFLSLAHWRPGYDFKISFFNLSFTATFRSSYANVLIRMPKDLTDDVNIGSGNGLLSSSHLPLLEPMLTQIYVAIWHHKATVC